MLTTITIILLIICMLGYLIIGSSFFFVIGIPLLDSIKKDSMYSQITGRKPNKSLIISSALLTLFVSLTCISGIGILGYELLKLI